MGGSAQSSLARRQLATAPVREQRELTAGCWLPGSPRQRPSPAMGLSIGSRPAGNPPWCPKPGSGKKLARLLLSPPLPSYRPAPQHPRPPAGPPPASTPARRRGRLPGGSAPPGSSSPPGGSYYPRRTPSRLAPPARRPLPPGSEGRDGREEGRQRPGAAVRGERREAARGPRRRFGSAAPPPGFRPRPSPGGAGAPGGPEAPGGGGCALPLYPALRLPPARSAASPRAPPPPPIQAARGSAPVSATGKLLARGGGAEAGRSGAGRSGAGRTAGGRGRRGAAASARRFVRAAGPGNDGCSRVLSRTSSS